MSESLPKTRFLKSYADPAALPTEGLPQVVFLGRSNAGKSSLINSLTGAKNLANVSQSPGRTRLINVFEVGGRYHMVDLPGYGFAKGSKKEREGLLELIHGYLSTAKLLKFAVLILDSRLGPTDLDREMIENLHQSGIPFLLVANKSDKLSRTELANAMDEISSAYPEAMVIAHSAVTKAGRGELLDAIYQVLTKGVE